MCNCCYSSYVWKCLSRRSTSRLTCSHESLLDICSKVFYNLDLMHIEELQSIVILWQQTAWQCCDFAFTESWLNDGIPDSSIQVDELTCYRADRVLRQGGKTRGGWVCVNLRDAWCKDTVVVQKHCTPLVEFMFLKCQPVLGVYSHIASRCLHAPHSQNNDRDWLWELNNAIRHQTAHPDGFLIVDGDFNHFKPQVCMPTTSPTCWHGEITHRTFFTQPWKKHTRRHPSPAWVLLITLLSY